ncbi:MAG: hypothetical protein ABJA02_02260 [Acidobacteriota bacterium]
MITNDIEPRWSVLAGCGFFGAALGTPLRRHHVSLIKGFLVFLAKNKDLSALNTWDLGIGHNVTSSVLGQSGCTELR